AGGTLLVTNLGSALHASDTFHLFNQPVAGFASVTLPPLSSPNTIWTNKLTVDGTIGVLSTASLAPVSVSVQATGASFTLSWPGDHTGWRLQFQTNDLETGLGTNWVDVIDSDFTNHLVCRLQPEKRNTFFRLL